MHLSLHWLTLHLPLTPRERTIRGMVAATATISIILSGCSSLERNASTGSTQGPPSVSAASLTDAASGARNEPSSVSAPTSAIRTRVVSGGCSSESWKALTAAVVANRGSLVIGSVKRTTEVTTVNLSAGQTDSTPSPVAYTKIQVTVERTLAGGQRIGSTGAWVLGGIANGTLTVSEDSNDTWAPDGNALVLLEPISKILSASVIPIVDGHIAFSKTGCVGKRDLKGATAKMVSVVGMSAASGTGNTTVEERELIPLATLESALG